MFPFNLFLTSFETRDSVVLIIDDGRKLSLQSIVMNFQTPKHLSSPFVFLKKEIHPQLNENAKMYFAVTMLWMGNHVVWISLLQKYERVALGNASLGHSKLIYDAVINEACKFS